MMHIEKGQSTVELMIVLAIALVLLAFLIDFTTTQLQQLQKAQAVKTAQSAADALVNAANIAFAQGVGTVQTIEIHLPSGIDSSRSRIQGKSIVFNVYDTDAVATANIPLSGSIPTSNGTRNVFVTATSNGVSFGTNYISASAATIYVPMARDTNQLTQIILSNSSTDAAAIATSLSWSHTALNASVSASEASINGNGTLNVDFNAVALASAIGNYTGVLSITATFPSSVETLNIPINVEVFANTGTLMNVVPNSLYFSTIGADSNSLSFQICNTGNSSLKNISFIPSSGNAGNWIQSISQISSLAAQSCTSKDVTITVPNGTPIGFYTGSMAVVDFSGANSQILPISIDVFGQSNAFFWDWNGTISGGTELTYFGLSNKSSGALTVKSIVLSRWWTCDMLHSQLTGMTVDNSSVYSGGTLDENELMDVNDFTIPENTTFTVNRLYFSGNVTNEGEQFQSLVTFEDDSNYISTVYGTGCSDDVTPPASVQNIVAYRGPQFKGVELKFTMPGDDGNSGTITDMNVRFSTSGPITNEAGFNAASPANASMTIVSGGAQATMTISDLNIGPIYYFAAKFGDEAGNWSDISNSPSNKAGSIYNLLLDGTSFNYFSAAGDTNKFYMQNFQKVLGATTGRILLHIDSLQENVSYTIDLNFDITNSLINRIRVWYPERYYNGIDQTDAKFDRVLSINMISGIDLLGSTVITNPNYRFEGSLFPSTALLTSNETTFIIADNTGITDFNIGIDATS